MKNQITKETITSGKRLYIYRDTDLQKWKDHNGTSRDLYTRRL